MNETVIQDSFAARLDPRAKLVSILAFSIFASVANRFSVLLILFLMGVCMLVLSRAPLPEIFKRLAPVNLMVLFLWCFLPFTFPGDTVFSMGSLSASREGILRAAQISVKCNAIMPALIALTMSSSISDIGRAMRRLGLNEKMTHLFLFAWRYAHVIHTEYGRLLWAAKIRGFSPKNNLHTYRTAAWLAGMTLVKSADRAIRVYNAMLCRGFDGKFYGINEFSMTKTDITVMAAMGAAVAGLGVVEWAHPIF
ncbi:Cobalt ECF transporter T component CbiQ [Candidatus Desulfarcum epimagneticum]|uniref:Cobalt ECF transporter T component CbiQ n=1 Tax=uncultured Desulfobacteraceae bacterium TaxID=218296 RepID=A0A484HH52_9BACT|nr:Cobalt ECF transporter T component CbiQ [uncultured Desulfobacteraceae bacterium]